MTENFINPISMSFDLLDGYRKILSENLKNVGLSDEDIEQVSESMEVDRGLYITLNREYLSGESSFRQYCFDHHLSQHLPDMFPKISHLRAHQEKGIQAILTNNTTIISTGTGSGKTETFLIPILDYCLKNPGPGIKALILYPMNALANDQVDRLKKAIDKVPECELSYAMFTGDTPQEERNRIRKTPPDILMTNYVMLEWMLTRCEDRRMFKNARKSLHYLVLDEIHTYRGNRATHLKFLLIRLKSLLENSLIQIGTSATLQSQTYDGYLQSESSKRLNQFICSLLDVEDYEFIEPEYEPETIAGSPNQQVPTPDLSQQLDWALTLDNAAGLANLTNLTGTKYHPDDLFLNDEKFINSGIYRDLLNNPFVSALRSALITKGAHSFTDLVKLLTQLLSEPTLALHAVEITKAYLSSIMFINHLAGDYPLLDLRVHLFLRDIGGYLKRCIKCKKYHSGRQEFCQDCGFPLFIVYKHNINKSIGKVSGNHLKWELQRETDDRTNSFYVLITHDGETDQGDTLAFADEVIPDKDNIVLDYEEYGRLKLTLLPNFDYSEISLQALLLSDERKDYQYLYGIVSKLLSYQKPDQRKILGFVDNREKANQYAIVFKDQFASDFFEAFLRLNYPHGREIDLQTTLELLHKQIPASDSISTLEQELFQELNLWYYRSLGFSPRKFLLQHDHLCLKNDNNLTEFERNLLSIFLNERAIDFRYPGDMVESRFIRLWRYLATDRTGIYLNQTDRSELPEYPGISLGSQGYEYREFIGKYTARLIGEAVTSLVQKGHLVSCQTADRKTHYYLSPRMVCFNLPPSEYTNYRELKRSLLRTAAVHSSEIKGEQRKEIEGKFNKSEIHFLCATPTLELGIDIGSLQMVLMIGVPPMPSNYAQRAGRAGRDAKNKHALIVTFCFESNPHDSHYFANPKQMIDGIISPPIFNPTNRRIAEKHINAFVLSEHIDSSQQFSRFMSEIDQEISYIEKNVKRLFGSVCDVGDYLHGEFKTYLSQEDQKNNFTAASNRQRLFYSRGFFPEYTFRQDQVYIVDKKYQQLVEQNPQYLTNISLSEREPELACKLLVPGQIMFMAGDVYKISANGNFQEIPLLTSLRTRSYKVLLAEKELKFAPKERVRQKYLFEATFDYSGDYQEKSRVLGIAYDPECTLTFVNRGLLKQDDTQPFSDGLEEFQLGYQLIRQALILRFDQKICYKRTLVLSLVAALYKAIVEGYGLDEAEIGLLTESLPSKRGSEESEFTYIVFYDSSGNGNIPFKNILTKFEQLVSIAYKKLSECSGSPNHPCTRGCYVCLKSYYTQYAASEVEKPVALMFLGYLLGKNPFIPSVLPYKIASDQFDLTLTVQRHGSQWHVQGRQQIYKTEIIGEQNSVLFNLLIQAIQSEFSPETKTLKIIVSDVYIADAINKGKINKNKEAFARLQFNLLRFRHVQAERGNK